MKDFLATHNQTFRAEWQKLRRTGIFWLCLCAAAFIPLILVLANFFMDPPTTTPANVWNKHFEDGIGAFTSFFYPLFIVLMVTRVVYVEYRSDTWKLMETQPVSKLALFLVKFEVGVVIALSCLLIELLFLGLGGFLLQIAKPATGFGRSSIDWVLLSGVLLRFWIASFGLIALQYFLVLLMKNFAWPVTVGLIGIIAGSVLSGFGKWNWFPFSAINRTSSAYSGSNTGAYLLHHEKLSLAWASLFLLLGYLYFAGKELREAYWKTIPKAALTIAALGIFGFLFWWIERPVTLKSYGRTVVAGSVIMEKPAKNIYLLKGPANDTVGTSPLANGRFHLLLPDSIDQGIYTLRIGNFMGPVYLNSRDSLHISIKDEGRMLEVDFGGTNIAENEYLNNEKDQSLDYMLTNRPNDFTPRAYATAVLSEWKSGKEQIESFKTVDNIRPSDDFISLQKKRLALRLLRLADITYPQSFAVYNPNDTLKFPASIDKLRSAVDLNDATMAADAEFTGYISEMMKWKVRAAHNRDSAYFTSMTKLIKSPAVRDALIFQEVRSRINNTNDSARRMGYMNAMLPAIGNNNYRILLTREAARLNALRRGQPAPDISTESLNGSPFNLSMLGQRFIVIDVWATWCGPCKRESPFFDEMAEKYTSERVAFVALSIDENKQDWKIQAPEKSKRVLQLWASNMAELTKTYALSSIPRFMLIDARGRLVNTQLPAPSDPEFEATLRREIPFLRDY